MVVLCRRNSQRSRKRAVARSARRVRGIGAIIEAQISDVGFEATLRDEADQHRPFTNGPTCSKPVMLRTIRHAANRAIMKVRESFCGAALILLLTIVAYIPALRCGFVWDDDKHFVENRAVISPEGL